jgi:hypothetical protein
MFKLKWKEIENQLMSFGEDKTKTHKPTNEIVEELSNPNPIKEETPGITFDKTKDLSENLRKELIQNDDIRSYKPIGTQWLVDKFETLLDKFGISMNDVVGQGHYSVVFSKHGVVYKFTKNKKDIEKMLFFHSIRNKIPEKYKKHIVEVYAFGYDEDSEYYYLSCEKLYPLSKTTKDLLLRGTYPTEFNLSTFFTKTIYKDLIETLEELQTSEPMRQAFNQVMVLPALNARCFELLINSLSEFKMGNMADEINNIENQLLSEPNDLQLKKKNKEIKTKVYNKISTHIIETIYKYVVNFVSAKYKKNKNDIYNFVSTETIDESVSVLTDMISKMFNRFPIHESQDIRRPNDNALFGADVLEFLRYLKDNYNIHFNDMHTGNFMQRADGDLVLSDVGYFKFK